MIACMQIYLPRLPGLPDDMMYYPNQFGLEYEVSVCCALQPLSAQEATATLWPLHFAC